MIVHIHKKKFKNTKIFLEYDIKFRIRVRAFSLNIHTLKTERADDRKLCR